ncbi:MAG: glycosyltransferase [Parcubacteria group bacterium]|nr:glycosyltransferase [Parcubacteria group bacterium]
MKKKYNVAFFTSARGGLAHYSVHLIREIEKLANPYFVTYANTEVDDLVKENINDIYQLINENDPSSLLKTIKFLKDKKIDFINFNIGTTARKSYLFYYALISQAKLMGIKIIGTIHDVVPFETLYINPDALDLLYSSLDYYIVGNEKELDKLQLYFKVSKNKITITSHGPYDLFNYNKYNKESARNFLDIKEEKKVILFFGLFRPHKGLKYLIKAFEKVVKKLPNALLYISSDLSYSNPQQNEILKRLEKSNISKYTKLVTKYVPSSEIEPIFKASDIIVMPYTKISQSGILNLAYAFKKPVIITDIFPNSEAINNNFGKVVKKADVTDLEKSILDMLSMPEKKIKKMGDAGHDYSLKENSWKKAAMQLNDIFHDLSTGL